MGITVEVDKLMWTYGNSLYIPTPSIEVHPTLYLIVVKPYEYTIVSGTVIKYVYWRWVRTL